MMRLNGHIWIRNRNKSIQVPYTGKKRKKLQFVLLKLGLFSTSCFQCELFPKAIAKLRTLVLSSFKVTVEL